MSERVPLAALESLMSDALALAARGRFRVEPNPTVGAIVLDRDGAVVGRGFHARWGGAHAEVAALAEAGERARAGTVIVTLEPCAHTAKKTPPCVGALIAAGVARVVAGTDDPNPATSGRAAGELTASRIEYESGVLGERCRAAVARYARHAASPRPWNIAKWAMSLDGRIADASGAARWISGEQSRRVVHELRGAVDAVIVGRGTIDADDPELTARVAGGSDPLRVVVDSRLSISPRARVVLTARTTPTLVITGRGADAARRSELERSGVEVAETEQVAGAGLVDLDAAMRMLFARGVRRTLIESGGRLAGAFAQRGLIDQVAAFVAPRVLGSGAPPVASDGWSIAQAPVLEDVRVTATGDDAFVEGFWPRGA